MSKVFIVGLDGATFDLIRPWAQEGKLPTLKRLMEEGVWGPLESTTPPMTSPAWPSFATGKYPDKHGVFDFVSAHSGTYNIVNATSVDARPLWDILSDQGKRVHVVNVPVTFPPHRVNGSLVSGLLSPSTADVSYPADLLRRYEAERDPAVPPYRVMPTVQYKPGNEAAFLRDLESLIEARVGFASWLMRDSPWDLMMVHFLATDLVQHALWRHMDGSYPRHVPGNPFQDAILRIYQRADRAMGELLSQLDPETLVIVMSDHGFGPLLGVVNLNMLLLQEGLLKLKRDPITQIRAFMFRHGLTPSTVYRWLARLNLQNVVSRVSKSTRNAVFNKFLSFDDIDWNRTVAYSLGHMGQIYLNVKGRERQGIIECGEDTGTSEEYERACERVSSALHSLTTPEGRPMPVQVIRKNTASPGRHAKEGPDLHVVLDDYRYISCPLFATDGHVLSQQIRGDSGSHRRHGVFIARGPGVRPGFHTTGARIIDVAPTVLRAMACPEPEDMDGRALTEAFYQEAPDWQGEHVMRVGATVGVPAFALSQEEEAEVELRLRGLGYLA